MCAPAFVRSWRRGTRFPDRSNLLKEVRRPRNLSGRPVGLPVERVDMGIDEPELSRLLRGDVPNGDPFLGEVSTFLDNLGTAYPVMPTTPLEGRHLAAVARESRLVHAELRHPRQRSVKRLFHGTHRILVGSVGALLIALTAGVGVASAFGINPLDQLMSQLRLSPPPASAATLPTAVGTDEPAGGKKNGDPGTTAPSAVPSSAPGPSPSATASGPVGEPTEADQTREEAEKAAKEVEKADEEAEKAAAKAKKEAEKASGQATPSPSPGKGHGKKGDAGEDKSGDIGSQEP